MCLYPPSNPSRIGTYSCMNVCLRMVEHSCISVDMCSPTVSLYIMGEMETDRWIKWPWPLPCLCLRFPALVCYVSNPFICFRKYDRRYFLPSSEMRQNFLCLFSFYTGLRLIESNQEKVEALKTGVKLYILSLLTKVRIYFEPLTKPDSLKVALLRD